MYLGILYHVIILPIYRISINFKITFENQFRLKKSDVRGWVTGCDRKMGDYDPICHNYYYYVNHDLPHEEDNENDPENKHHIF